MTIHLAIDDTAVRTNVEELLELIGVYAQSEGTRDALVITDTCSRAPTAARAVIRIGTDLNLPRDAELLLRLVEKHECSTSRVPAPVVTVVGASGRAPVSKMVGRALAGYRAGRPLTVIDLGDDPTLRKHIARTSVVPEIIPWKNISVDEPVVSTRLGDSNLAIVCGADSVPPTDPVPWIASLATRGPVLIDGGRITAASADVASQISTHIVISARHASTFQVRVAIERLPERECELIVSGRRPRATWAAGVQWRPVGVTRLIARILEGET